MTDIGLRKATQLPAARRPLRVTRRHLLTGAAGLAGLTAASTAAYAGAVEPYELVVTHYAPKLPAWPSGHGLSVTVIADIHAGGPNMTLGHIRHIVDTANDLRSDLTVILGDFNATHRFVTEHVSNAQWAAELARLEAPLGTWSILGNHDWWHDLAGVRRGLDSARIPVLENDAVLIGPEGKRFWLAGLGDQEAYRLGYGRFVGVDDLPLTMSRIKTDDPVLLLAHEPDIFPQVSKRVALTLSGHTHGGQIRIPGVWPSFVPSRYGARFAYGHIVENDRHLIVSGGLGTSIVPARFGVPPEILHITLGA